MNTIIFHRFSAFRRGRDSQKYKPHKPLLVLLALRTMQQKGTSEIKWNEAKAILDELIQQFNNVNSVKPHDPFYRLTKDATKFGGIWKVDIPLNDKDYVSQLNSKNPTGRFPLDIEKELHSDKHLINQIIRQIIEMQFEPSEYDEVLDAFGFLREEIFTAEATPVLIEFEKELEKRRKGSWPKQILQIWDFKCAFCGYGGFLDEVPVGLDAAHIRSFKKDGPDEPDNGLALCTLHHRLFDRGVIGLTEKYEISISNRFRPVPEHAAHFEGLAGKFIKPLGLVEPSLIHIRWHQDTIFKH